jgi:hypothetical protein
LARMYMAQYRESHTQSASSRRGGSAATREFLITDILGTDHDKDNNYVTAHQVPRVNGTGLLSAGDNANPTNRTSTRLHSNSCFGGHLGYG